MVYRATRTHKFNNGPIPMVNRVALWGDVGCGKDTWAATLPFATEQSGLSVRPFDEITAQWQAETRARMSTGDFPYATDVPRSADELKLLTFELGHEGSAGFFARPPRLLIQIPQAAGGWWTDPHTYQKMHIHSPNPYEYLSYASGIICFLDPTSVDPGESAAALMTMLDYLDVYRRRHKRRQHIRIALWLTKMDHPQHRSQKAREEAYSRTLFGHRLANFLLLYGRLGGYEFRWGGCSAVGSVTHQGRIRSNTYWDYSMVDRDGNPMPVHRILDPKALVPENVLEPLRWVMEPMARRARASSSFFGNLLWRHA